MTRVAPRLFPDYVRQPFGSDDDAEIFYDGTDLILNPDAIGPGVVKVKGGLHVDSTTKGFLKPRMTTTQRDAVSAPENGLEIYNTTNKRPEFYDGTSWVGNAVKRPVRTVTGNTTLTLADAILHCDCTSGAISVTVLAALDGEDVWVKKTDSSGNVVNFVGNIEGDSSRTLAVQFAGVTVYGDGTNNFLK